MFSLAFEGGDELAQELSSLSVRMTRAIVVDALMDGGQPIRDLVAQAAPRAPGAPDLADHINIGALRRRPGQDEQDFSVGIGVPREFFYDFFQEYGTVRMSAHPFWRPAFDTQVPASLGIIGAAMWTALASRGIGRTVNTPSPVQSLGSSL